MKTQVLHEEGGLRTLLVVLDTGEEVLSSLQLVAENEKCSAAQVTAIGAFSEARLLFFDWDSKQYTEIPVNEQCEVAALVGDIALDQNGAPAVHVHVVLGKRDGAAVAGHLDRALVRPTLEVIINENPAHMRRVRDPVTGLNLIWSWNDTV